jgi:hypothetical protein
VRKPLRSGDRRRASSSLAIQKVVGPSPSIRSVGAAPPDAERHAWTAPDYRDRYQQTKARIGKRHGASVAQNDLARRLAEAIWYMLTRNQAFAPKGATDPLGRLTVLTQFGGHGKGARRQHRTCGHP